MGMKNGKITVTVIKLCQGEGLCWLARKQKTKTKKMNLQSPNSIGRLAAVALISAAFLSQAFASSTTVSVNFGSAKSPMSSQGLGVASAVYDGYLTSSGVGSALKSAGVQAVRYPGGSYADIFHWQNYTSCGGVSRFGQQLRQFHEHGCQFSGRQGNHHLQLRYPTRPARTVPIPAKQPAGSITPTRPKATALPTGKLAMNKAATVSMAIPGWEEDLHYPYNGIRAGQYRPVPRRLWLELRPNLSTP